MIDPSVLQHAIATHAKWKSRLRQAIASGQSEWTVETVRPDNLCEFGKWLASLQLPDRFTKEYKDVKVLHEQFHAAAAEVLEKALVGQRAEAEAMMAPGGTFAAVTTKLVKLLTEWQKTAGKS